MNSLRNYLPCTQCSCCLFQCIVILNKPCTCLFLWWLLSVCLYRWPSWTSSDFEWQTITNQLSSGDFSDTLLAILIIVSFVDVWLNLGAMILQCFKIMCVVLQGNDTFHKLLVRSFDRFGRESEIEEDKALEILHRRINDIYYIRY